MNTFNLLNGLNSKQKEAVTSPYNNLLVLAGAGSGKTRVLVNRIAWLISVKCCTPYSVIAVTFTNKAALEIRDRIENTFKNNSHNKMWIGTFHGLAYRLLRTHYHDVNLPHDFRILDREDQLQLLKNLICSMKLDKKQWLPHKAMWYIENKKDDCILFPQKEINNSIEATWHSIYLKYQEECNRYGLIDLSELLIRAYKLWLNKPHILYHYRERFTNILVDEFQDTNKIQYAWIRLLAGNKSNVMVVGDDDQSIYGWRGAQVENIQRFLSDFPNVHTISLEQNYRSTSNILKSANALISHNSTRLTKNLWTDSDKGDPITIYCAFSELDEARFVINRIRNKKKQGRAFKDSVILYRNNVQSRVLEEELFRTGLPYQIYSGIRFFDRQEIKNALAYLRLIANRNDDIAYELIVNIPARGIGNHTIDIVRQMVHNRKLTLWQSSKIILAEHIITGCSAIALQHFLDLIDKLAKETAEMPLHMQTDWVIKNSGLWNMYKQDNSEKGHDRIKNLEELVTATKQFSYDNKYHDYNIMPLQHFLDHVYLNSKYYQDNDYQDAVQLMTIHSAKGLEFPQVFIVGLEEGIFPCQSSIKTVECLEEERRLAYVGITRAMYNLTITYAKSRRLYGKKKFHQPSRFIRELTSSCIEKIQLHYCKNNLDLLEKYYRKHY